MPRKIVLSVAVLALASNARAQDPQVYTSGSSGISATQANSAVAFTNNHSGGDSAAFLARSVRVSSRAASANTCYVDPSDTTATTGDIPLAPGATMVFSRTFGYSPESGWAGIGIICATGETATIDVVATRADLSVEGVARPILLPAGDATAPALAFDIDPDNGLYGASQQFIINTGIGYPRSRLTINGNGTLSSQFFAYEADADWSGWLVFPTTHEFVVTAQNVQRYRMGPAEFSLTTPLRSVGVAFASLGTPANGSLIYCTDCAVADPCAGSGTGAFAKRLNGAWVCN